jgi:hypothetical protein
MVHIIFVSGYMFLRKKEKVYNSDRKRNGYLLTGLCVFFKNFGGLFLFVQFYIIDVHVNFSHGKQR